MALRLMHKVWPHILAAIVLSLVVQRGNAQTADAPKKAPDQTPAAKELPKEDIDALTEKAFGSNSEEMGRPIRVWVPSSRILLAAKEASVAKDGRSIRFTLASVAMMDGEVKVLQGDAAVIGFDQPVMGWKDARGRHATSVEIHGKNSIASVTRVTNDQVTLSGAKFGTVIRFEFKIDAKKPLSDLLPKPTQTAAKMPHWTNEDLAKVPELAFGEPISKELPKFKAMEATAHAMAKISHLNRKKTDGFMLAMLENRTDLRGLPSRMGEDCRTREEQARIFAMAADSIRQLLQRVKSSNPDQSAEIDLHVDDVRQLTDHRAAVAALTQILMPESKQMGQVWPRALQ